MSLRRPRSFAPLGGVRFDNATLEVDPRGARGIARAEAEDRVGLLGFVLAGFAALSLFPERFSVRTEGRACAIASSSPAAAPAAARAGARDTLGRGGGCAMSDRFHVASLSEADLERVRGLESQLGKAVVALEPAAAVAELSGDQIADLQHAERELGVVLVAFESAR